MIDFPYTPEGYEKAKAQMDSLIAKKYNYRTDGDGLTAAEERTLQDLFAWQKGAMSKVSDYYVSYCRLKVGDIVEATFDDGTLYARISEEFNNSCYHIQTLEGGGGCTIQPHKVRKLSPVEVFTLGVERGHD